jgi:hypothetical protein
VVWSILDSNPSGEKEISSSSKLSHHPPFCPPFSSFLEIKLTGREVNHSLPPSVKVANEQSYTAYTAYTASICLRGVDRGFVFFSESFLAPAGI